MPIKNASWASLPYQEDRNIPKGLDLHILRGQSTPDLSAHHLAFQLPDNTVVFAQDYLINPDNADDVDVEFRPQILAVLNAGIFAGGGVWVSQTTGVVMADDPLPTPHLRNFILLAEVANKADGTHYSLPIRIHIHESVSQVWLTPDTLTIQRLGVANTDFTGYRFSVRAQFDDGTVGDLTNNHGVTWSPPSNVFGDAGGIFLGPSDVPGGSYHPSPPLCRLP